MSITLSYPVNVHPEPSLPTIETDRCYHFIDLHSNYILDVVERYFGLVTGDHHRAVIRWNSPFGDFHFLFDV